MPPRATVAMSYILVALSTACASEEERPPVVWAGEYLEFGTYEDVDLLCGGTLTRADEFTGYVGGLFGASPSISYYWDTEELHPRCNQESPGCSIGAEAFGKVPLLEHELVHAAKTRATYPPLEEGIAQLLGAPVPPVGELQGDITELYARHEKGEPLSRGWYPVAGFFVSYLAFAHGWDRLVDLERRAVHDDSWSKMQEHFLDAFGVAFEELVDDRHDTYPACDQFQYQDIGFDCRDETLPITIGTGLTRIHVELDCAAPDVVGPQWGERWALRTFEVSEEDVYDLRISKVGGGAPGNVEFLECGRTCSSITNEKRFAPAFELVPVESEEQPSIGLFATIPAGLYVARFSVEDSDTGDFVLTIQR